MPINRYCNKNLPFTSDVLSILLISVFCVYCCVYLKRNHHRNPPEILGSIMDSGVAAGDFFSFKDIKLLYLTMLRYIKTYIFPELRFYKDFNTVVLRLA